MRLASTISLQSFSRSHFFTVYLKMTVELINCMLFNQRCPQGMSLTTELTAL